MDICEFNKVSTWFAVLFTKKIPINRVLITQSAIVKLFNIDNLSHEFYSTIVHEKFTHTQPKTKKQQT